MSPEITVMGGELGNIFWDLAPWIVYSSGYDLGCTIYVANPTDAEKEYTLMSRLTSGTTVISEEAIKVFGYAWFKVAPKDFIRLRGSLRSDETDVVLSVLLVERETERIADSVFTSLVAPSVSALPPTWPGTSTSVSSGFDWSSLVTMIVPIAMLGMVIPMTKSDEQNEARKTPEEKTKNAG